MSEKYYIGIDVGGTKISAGLVTSIGKVLDRYKHKTPRGKDRKELVRSVSDVIEELLAENSLSNKDIAGIGLGVPGLLDKKRERILTSPNMNTSGLAIVPELRKRFKVNVAADNDVNVGVLGECWLGAAKGLENIVGIFPGTGVGGGIIVGGELYVGGTGAAAEVGHVIVDAEGPMCTCGNRGCLEAIAGRWAIERDIRSAVKKGRKTLVTKLSKSGLKVIKSGVLAQALAKKDPLTLEIMRNVSEKLGTACINLRHIFDPEMIILGGGIIEACGDFMLPIIKKVFDSDKYFPRKGCRLVRSKLGDDAIILGAVALVYDGTPVKAQYPSLLHHEPGRVVVGGKPYSKDLYIRADSKIKERPARWAKEIDGSTHKVSAKELKKICKKKPDVLIIGTGRSGCLKLDPDAEKFLKKQKMQIKVLPTPEAVKFYNSIEKRKAILLHLAC